MIEHKGVSLVIKKVKLSTLKGIGLVTAEKLLKAGYDSIEALAKARPERLQEIPGIGAKLAIALVYEANYHLGANEEMTVEPIEEVVEPVREEIVGPIEEEVVEPFREEVAEPVWEEVVESVREEVMEPVKEEIVEPIEEEAKPLEEEVIEPVREVVEPVREEVVEPIEEEVIEPVREEVIERTREEVVESVREEIAEPIKEEIVEPVREERKEMEEEKVTTFREALLMAKRREMTQFKSQVRTLQAKLVLGEISRDRYYSQRQDYDDEIRYLEEEMITPPTVNPAVTNRMRSSIIKQKIIALEKQLLQKTISPARFFELRDKYERELKTL